MMRWLCLIPIGLLVLAGCGRNAGDTATGNPAAAPPATDAAAARPQPLAGTVDPAMTAALKAFVQEKGRLPQSMVELKNTKLDSIPRAPQGYGYAIDPVTIEVKLVKQ